MGNETDQKAHRFQRDLLRWSEDNLRSFPWRETNDPYKILIAEFLLQRTQARRVEPIYLELIKTYPDFQDLADCQPEQIADLLRPLGLQNKRSQALIDIANRLENRKIPAEKSKLRKLSFIGPYCSNAILCFAFDEPEPILDQNVIRIYERLFGIDLDHRKEEAWDLADQLLPDSDIRRYNLALLDFAAEICASEPQCQDCFASEYCTFYSGTE